MTMHDDHEVNDADNPWADRINEAYYDGMGGAFGQKTRERINWMCAQARGVTVLDVGCSQGIASILMAREGMRVIGLDIYPPAIEYANGERAKEVTSVQERLEFRCGELAMLDPGQFDTVVMGEVVEHQTNPNRFIREGAARVAPGGRLIITVPFGLNPWPDHKSTVFPRDLHDAIADEFAMASIEVVDGYIRIVADRRATAGKVRDDVRALIKETEKGALDAQVSYYAVSATSQEHAKAKVALEAAGKSYRDQIAKLNVRISVLEREVAVANERAAGLDAAVEVARQAASEIGATYHEMLRAAREVNQADHAEQVERINASRSELAEVRKAQVELAETHAQRLTEMLGQVAQLREQVALLQVELVKAKDLEREAVERERSKDAELEQCVRKLKAELKEAQDDREAQLDHLGIERSRVEMLQSELADAHHEASAAMERERLQQAQLDALRASEAAYSRAASEMEKRLELLKAELEESQFKRSAHWAKLEAQRTYSQQLVQFAEGLHEENQRYENSIALAIGRALLALRSVKGIVGFPRAILGVVRLAQRRREGALPSTQLEWPALRTVAVAESAKRVTAPSLPASSTTENAVADREEEKKKLTIIGWEQPESYEAIRVMSVLDEFSRACFAPHANLIEARPDNWEGLFDKFSPRLLFAESAWRGNGGAWRYRVARSEHPPGDEFVQMVAGFRKRNLPTIFWNKEDPVHFEAFLQAAGCCDIILTTSAESVARYRKETAAQIEVMQFGAEDTLHNPQGSAQRNGKVCFAGSYYAEGFEVRQSGQAMLLEAAKDFELDIYDRNHRGVGAPNEFAFPEAYAPHIRGRLDYKTLSRKYREYQVFLNVNSVSDSATMFSRRVFELLACGTPIVSTWSCGIEETFGDDVVWQVRDQAEATEALRVLTSDSAEWRRRSLAGIRAVLSRHTYRHRFAKILTLAGERSPDPDLIVALAEVATTAEADIALAAFSRQQITNDIRKQLVLVCRDGLRLEGTWPDVRVLPASRSPLAQLIGMEQEASPGAMVAVFSPYAVYGRHYLLDAVLSSRYSRAHVVGKSVRGAEYEWGHALDPCSLVFDTAALAAASMKPVDLLDPSGIVVPAYLAQAYAADSANFARVEAGADRDALLKKIEI